MKYLFPETFEVNDLTKALRLVKESADGFSKLFDSSPACMSLTTPDRTFVKVNQKFLEIFDFTEDEILGFTSEEIGILDPKEHEKVSALLRENGRLHNDTVICRKKSGELVYTVSSIEKIERNGEVHLLSSFLDITKIILQQQIIEKQNKEILDSINYARLIQNTLLLSQKQIDEILPDSFVLTKPKNIVSGDFYWIKKIGDKIFVSACDCTGHGVPGALISIIGYKLLSKFVGEYERPADILNQLNKEFSDANGHAGEAITEMKDGMDIALCTVDRVLMTMEYAGAYNPIYMVRNGELAKLAVDKIPVHLFTSYTGQQFNNYQIQIEEGDAFYLFSDGYADQFGGPSRKKFRYKNFQELIISIHHLPMAEQKEIFDRTIEEWKLASGEEQTDDILIVGFKI